MLLGVYVGFFTALLNVQMIFSAARFDEWSPFGKEVFVRSKFNSVHLLLTHLSLHIFYITDRSKAGLLIWFSVFACFDAGLSVLFSPYVCLDDI